RTEIRTMREDQGHSAPICPADHPAPWAQCGYFLIRRLASGGVMPHWGLGMGGIGIEAPVDHGSAHLLAAMPPSARPPEFFSYPKDFACPCDPMSQTSADHPQRAGPRDGAARQRDRQDHGCD